MPFPFQLGGMPNPNPGTVLATGAAGAYTTEALISSIRRRGMFSPTDDGTSFPRDSDIIATANEEMAAFLVPWIMRAREGHFINFTDIPLVQGQANYSIPPRAMGDDVSVVQIVDTGGNVLSYLGPTQQDLEVAVQYPFASQTGFPREYAFRGNNIVLYPAPNNVAQFLRVYYPLRPNQLVPSAQAIVVTNFAGGAPAGSFRLGYPAVTLPSGFSTSGTFEIVHSQPGFEVAGLGPFTSITSTYAEFVGSPPTGFGVGDYFCITDTAPVMTGVPADMLPLFAQWLAYKLSEYRRDEPAMKATKMGFDVAEKLAMKFLGKRDQLGHRKITSSRNTGMRRPPFFSK